MLILINIFAKNKILKFVNMNVKSKVLSAGVLFFLGGNMLLAQQDTITKTTEIEEVVLTGSYGVKQTAEQVTGASVKVSGDALQKPSAVSIDGALQGQVAGFMSTASSGQPGAATITLIRGINSLTGSNNPLYVVDGVPIPSGDISGLLTTQNALSNLNPADIENVEVLKDGVATSIYGSRGSNGVILITTKSGRKGRSELNFLSEMGASTLAYDKFDMLNAEENVRLMGVSLFNVPGQTQYATLQDAVNAAAGPTIFDWNGSTNTDWYKAVSRNSPAFQRYNLTYSGGFNKFSIYSSLGYMQQEGLSRDSEFNRYNGMLKGIWEANDKLKMNFSINLSQTRQMGPADGSAFSNPMFAGRIMSPTQSLYAPDGSYNLDLYFLNRTFNPVAIQEANVTSGDFTKVLTTVGADYEIIDNLRFNTVFGYDKTTGDELQFWNPDFGDGYDPTDTNGNGIIVRNFTNRNIWNWYNFLHYNKTFAEKHDLSLSVGMEATRTEIFSDNVTKQGTPAGSRRTNLSNFINPIAASNSISKRGLVGYIGRASYTFNKYLTLTGTFRRDGYSGFSDYYGNFYGAGFAMDFGKTNLMPDQFRSLKLRGSYGENGNTTVGPYNKFPLYSVTAQYAGEEAGNVSNPGAGGVDGIFWEASKKMNVGLDFALKGKLNVTGSIDLYKNDNTSQIIAVPVPPSSGVGAIQMNQATSYSKGIEASLGLDLAKNASFNWTTKFNYSYNDSKVTDLTGDPTPTLIDGTKAFFPGHNPSEFYTRLWAGVDASNGNPLWYTDETRTTITNNVNDAKLSFTGKKALPTHIASWYNEMDYKGFKLSFLFNFQGDYSVYDRWAFVYDSDGAYSNLNQLSAQLYDSWTPDNIDATRPKVVRGGNRNSSNASTRYLYDGDHIRLKTLELGYRFTKNVLNVDGLNGIYVYVRGVNLWTHAFDKDLYFDPESNSNAFAYTASNLGIYDQTQPNLKQYLFGISVDF